MTINILAQLTAKKGKLDVLLKHVIALQNHANQEEPGTTFYIAHQDPENDHKIIIYEQYASEEAFHEHQAQPPFVAIAKEVNDILDGGLDIKHLNKLS